MEAGAAQPTQPLRPQNRAFRPRARQLRHFTSPIRRYADLLVHRALVDSFRLEQPAPKGKLPPGSGLSELDRADLSKVTEAISQTERRAMEAERDTIDRYVAAWLSGRVGESFKCRITGVQSFGFFATILGLGGDGLVPVSSLGREYFRYEEGARAWSRIPGAYAVGRTSSCASLSQPPPERSSSSYPATAASPSSRAAPRPARKKSGSGDPRGAGAAGQHPPKGEGRR